MKNKKVTEKILKEACDKLDYTYPDDENAPHMEVGRKAISLALKKKDVEWKKVLMDNDTIWNEHIKELSDKKDAEIKKAIDDFLDGELRAYCSMCDYSQEAFKELVSQFDFLKQKLGVGK